MMRPESYQEIDFTGLDRKAQRQLLNRVRDSKVKKAPKMHRRSAVVEVACERAIGEIKDTTGETISRALAVRLIEGTTTKICGKFFRGSSDGAIYAVKPPYSAAITLEKLCKKIKMLRSKKAVSNFG